MTEKVKKLKVTGLYVLSFKVGSYRYCKLMSEHHDSPLRNYTSSPIDKIGDFIKMFEKSLSYLDWNIKEYTKSHAECILNMEKQIEINGVGKLIVKK